LQAAVTAAVARGATLELDGSKTYTVTSTVTVSGACKIHGNGAVVNGTGVASGPVFSVTGDDVFIDNVEFVASPTKSAVEFLNADRSVIRECTVSACWKGITFTNCSDAVADLNNITITGEDGGAGHGILFAKSGATTASGFIFTRNTVHVEETDFGNGIWWYGGEANGATDVSVFNGVVANNVVSGGFGGIWGTCGQFINVADNVIRDFYDVGVDFEGCWDCVATGNVLTRVRGGALTSLYTSKRLTFTGNHVWTDRTTKDLGAGALPTSSSYFALLRNDGEDIVIHGNTFISVGSSVTGEINLFKSASSTGVKRVTIKDNYFHNGALKAIGGQSELSVEGNRWYHDYSPEEICCWIRQTSGIIVRGNDFWMASNMTGSGDGNACIYVDQLNASSTPRVENVLIENNRVRNRPNTGIAVNTYNGTDAKTYIVRDNITDNVYYRTASDPVSAVRSNNLKPADNGAATVTGF